MASIFDTANDVSKLDVDQLQAEQQNRTRRDVPEWMLLGILNDKITKLEALQSSQAAGQGFSTVGRDLKQKAMQLAGLEAIPVPDNYYRSEEETAQLAGGGIVAFANEGYVDPIFSAPDMSDTQVPSPLPYQEFIDRLTLPQLQEYYRSGAVPENLRGREPTGWGSRGAPLVGRDVSGTPKAATPKVDEEITPAPKKAEGKSAVSDKLAKKVEKAEDSYEKALREELDKTNMSEDDKMRALGFALIKFGAKAAKGKRGREIEALTEGAADAADEYVKTLNQAKKDKRELTKAIAEYGLAKEKIGVQREQVAATREGAAETRALRESMQQDALKQKYLVEYQKRYGDGTMNPQYLRDGVLNPKWKSFERWLKESGINIGGGASQGEAGIPGERPPIGSVITPR